MAKKTKVDVSLAELAYRSYQGFVSVECVESLQFSELTESEQLGWEAAVEAITAKVGRADAGPATVGHYQKQNMAKKDE